MRLRKEEEEEASDDSHANEFPMSDRNSDDIFHLRIYEITQYGISAKRFTLDVPGQGKSEAGYRYHLGLLSGCLERLSLLPSAQAMIVVTTGLTFVQKRKSNVRSRSSLELGPNISWTL